MSDADTENALGRDVVAAGGVTAGGETWGAVVVTFVTGRPAVFWTVFVVVVEGVALVVAAV